MKLTKNSRTILSLRYLKKGKEGRPIEKPEALFRRVAKNISLADAKYKYRKICNLMTKYNEDFFHIIERKEFKSLIKSDYELKKTENEFYEMMANLDFLPNSPTLFNAGRKLQQLAACFVLPIEDDMNSIFQTLHRTAIISQSGAGTGFSFSRLRPRGDMIKSTQGCSSGPVSFMKIFDCATEQIKQGGKRRGANMGILRIEHPDIEEFITLKNKEGMLDNFNISVGVTDKFMKALFENKNYDLINPRTHKKVGSRNARKILKMICENAWKTADPGVVFLDVINRKQPTPKLGKIESTNPCGEIPLLPYEACNLGSINLANFVKEGSAGKLKNKSEKKTVDYEQLKSTVWKAVHFLDNVIDMSNYVFGEIKQIVHGNRKIGLGVMGFADMLVQLEIKYDSEKAVKLGGEIMKFINQEAKKASAELAKKRGVFPNFNKSIYNTGRKGDRVRNATRTSVAPTGTISIIAGCSSGIEPLFALAYTHTIVETKKITEINRYLIKKLKENRIYSKQLINKIIDKGSLEGIKGIPKSLKRIFVVTHNISPEYHVKMQAVFQKYTDNAVSKTVNLPYNATPKDVEKIYLLAYKLGCKGISIYRYGSKKGQILSIGEEKAKEELSRCPTCGR